MAQHQTGETVHLPLSKLVMSRDNPRKTKPNTADGQRRSGRSG